MQKLSSACCSPNAVYELFLPGTGRSGENVIKLQRRHVSKADAEIEKDVTKFDSARLLNVFGFSDVNCHTSLSMFKAIDAAESISFGNMPLRTAQSRTFQAWYKVSIRQLPPTAVIAKLSTAFFKHIN